MSSQPFRGKKKGKTKVPSPREFQSAPEPRGKSSVSGNSVPMSSIPTKNSIPMKKPTISKKAGESLPKPKSSGASKVAKAAAEHANTRAKGRQLGKELKERIPKVDSSTTAPQLTFDKNDLFIAAKNLHRVAVRDYTDPLQTAHRLIMGKKYNGKEGYLNRWTRLSAGATPAVSSKPTRRGLFRLLEASRRSSVSSRSSSTSEFGWARNYVVITSDRVLAFETRDAYSVNGETAAIESLDLNNGDLHIVQVPGQDDFLIKTKAGEMKFMADDERSLKLWLRAFRGVEKEGSDSKLLLPANLREAAKKEYETAIKVGGAKSWMRSKLMLVGEGRVGKTATVRSLLGMSFDPNLESTVGADASKTCVIDKHERVTNWAENKGKQVKEYDRILAQFVAQRLEDKALSEQDADLKKEERYGQYLSPRDNATVTTYTLNAPTMDGAGDDKSTSKKSGRGEQPTCSSKAKKDVQETTIRGSWLDDDVSLGDDADSLADVEIFPTSSETAKKFDEDLVMATLKEGDNLSFQLWDFGGQRVFYTLHHLFLTRYGVYLCLFNMEDLVGSPRRKQQALEYLTFWLNSVKMHADGAPFFLVGTHKDVVNSSEQHMAVEKTLRSDLKLDWVKNLVTNEDEDLMFFPIDNTAGAQGDMTLQNLRRKIEESVLSDDYVSKQIPISWMKTLDAMKDTNEPKLSLSHTIELGAECDVSKSEVLAMLSLFHELGVLLHFDQNEDLRNIVVMDPQWLIDAISLVIRDYDLHDKDIRHVASARQFASQYRQLKTTATLSDQLLNFLWRDLDVGETMVNRNFLRALMEDMSLLCRWETKDKRHGRERNGQTYLVPSLLPAPTNGETSKFMFDGLDFSNKRRSVGKPRVPKEYKVTVPMMFYFDFDEFYLPNGLFERLVCLAVSHSLNSFRTALTPKVTQSTAELSFGSATFRMQAVPKKRQIQVLVLRSRYCPLVRVHLQGMMDKLRDEVMHNRLQYSIKLLPRPHAVRGKFKFDFKQAVDLAEVENCKDSELDSVAAINGKVVNLEDVKWWFPMKTDAHKFWKRKGDHGAVRDMRHRAKSRKADQPNSEPEATEEDEEAAEAAFEQLVKDEEGDVDEAQVVQDSNGNFLNATGEEALDSGNEYHFFISHFQKNGGDQAQALSLVLEIQGFKVWYDNAQDKVTKDAIVSGIEKTQCVVLFLTRGALQRPFVQLEVQTAIRLHKPLLMLWETDRRKEGFAEIYELRDEAPKEFRILFDEVEAIPYRRRTYEIQAMVQEMRRRMVEPVSDLIVNAVTGAGKPDFVNQTSLRFIKPDTILHQNNRPSMVQEEASSSKGSAKLGKGSDMYSWLGTVPALSMKEEKKVALADALTRSGYDVYEAVQDLTEEVLVELGPKLTDGEVSLILGASMEEFLRLAPALIPSSDASAYAKSMFMAGMNSPQVLKARLAREKRTDGRESVLQSVGVKRGHIKRILRAVGL